MTQGADATRLIRPGDFRRICEIDYMPNLCGASRADRASRFKLH